MKTAFKGSLKSYYGNKEVVELAKVIYREARKGKLATLAFAAQRPPDSVCFAWAGSHGGVTDTVKGLELIKGEMEEAIAPRKSGPQKEGVPLSHVEYNLQVSPLNFDFVAWMVHAEFIRLNSDAPGPLRIGFKGRENLNEEGIRVFDAILRPALVLLGAVESDAAIGGWRNASLTPSEMVVGVRKGMKMPVLRADGFFLEKIDDWLFGKPKPIVITLREASHWEHRNSNVDAWVKFGRDLRDKGEHVVFLRDTEKANLPLEDFETCPKASFNLRMRMALYARSKCNLFISNGPGALGIFGPYPYLYFIDLKRVGDYDTNTQGWWLAQQGIGSGEDWPWATPQQKMIWAPDDYKSISEAWEKHAGLF